MSVHSMTKHSFRSCSIFVHSVTNTSSSYVMSVSSVTKSFAKHINCLQICSFSDKHVFQLCHVCFFQLENFQSSLETCKSVQISPHGAKSPPLLAATSFLHCFSARSHASISEDCSNLSKAVGTVYVSKEVTEERRRALGNECWVVLCVRGWGGVGGRYVIDL